MLTDFPIGPGEGQVRPKMSWEHDRPGLAFEINERMFLFQKTWESIAYP
jgi:hypothetical protein